MTAEEALACLHRGLGLDTPLNDYQAIIDKAEELMQVAGLVCLDLDLLNDVDTNNRMTAEELRKYIQHVHEGKEELINKPEERKSRYRSCSLLFDLCARGLVASTPLKTKP